MVSCFFNFSANDRVIWLAPNTKSVYAVFLGTEVKADGNVWAQIKPLPGLNNQQWNGDSMFVLADQIVPAF